MHLRLISLSDVKAFEKSMRATRKNQAENMQTSVGGMRKKSEKTVFLPQRQTLCS